MTTVLSRTTGHILSPAEEFKAFELVSWNHSSEHYARSFATLTNKVVTPLLDALEIFPDASLLDICCGSGALAAAAHMRGVNVVGIDFADNMLTLARANYPDLQFEKGDAERLAVSDSCFDYASMAFGLDCLGQPELAIAEAARILIPSGRFACTVWDFPERVAGFGLMLSAIKDLGEVEIDLSTSPDFFQFADPAHMSSTLRRSGFSSVEFQRLELCWDLASADELFNSFFNGIGRTSSLLRAQPERALQNIRARIVKNAQKNYSRYGGRIFLPMNCVLYCAQK